MSDELEVAQRPLVALRFRQRAAEDLVHREAHVLVDAEPRQQRMVLKHDGAIRAGLDHLAIVDEHVARVAGVRPATMLSSVDLPQPECPMIETNSPLRTVNDTSRSTSVPVAPPKLLWTFSICT